MKTVSEARAVINQVIADSEVKPRIVIKADKVKGDKHLVFKDGTRRSFRIKVLRSKDAVDEIISRIVLALFEAGFHVEYHVALGSIFGNPEAEIRYTLRVTQGDKDIVVADGKVTTVLDGMTPADVCEYNREGLMSEKYLATLTFKLTALNVSIGDCEQYSPEVIEHVEDVTLLASNAFAWADCHH